MKIRNYYVKLKKSICSVLVICFLVSLFPTLTFADTIYSGNIVNGNWTYNENTGVLDVYGNGQIYCLNESNPKSGIAESIGKYNREIFRKVKTINIHEGITEIGNNLFSHINYGAIGESASDCMYLESINFPSTLKTIEESAFWYTNFNRIELIIPENVTKIGATAFISQINNDTAAKTNLKRVTILNDSIILGVNAFKKTVIVGEIGSSAQVYCADTGTECVFYTPEEIEATLKKITLNEHYLNLESGENYKIGFSVSPSTLETKWVSSNESVAVADQNGNITAKNNGTAEIILQSLDGKVKDSCTVNVTTPVNSISLNTNNINLNTGNTYQLNASILPSHASDKTVKWKSENSSIAIVLDNGLVTAVQNGTTAVTAETSNGKTVSCIVKVTTPVKGINTSIDNITLNENTVYQLNADIQPETASNKNIKWSSNNNDVAAIGNNGQLMALKKGTAIITAESAENSSIKTTCTITVKEADTTIKAVQINESALDMAVGEKYKLNTYISPADTPCKWSSDNTSIASVDSNGNVTAKANGTAVITLQNTDGKLKDTCIVKVTTPVSSVTLNKNSISMNKGSTQKLTVSILPSNATDKSINWISSNESVANVSADGTITGVSNGTAVISAVTHNELKAVCVADVKTPVTGIVMDNTTLTIPENSTYQLNANILPETASNKKVNWSSNNTDVVTVGGNGQIIALKAGTAVITAESAENNSFKTSCTVTVKEVNNIVKSIKLNENKITINKGEDYKIGFSISPADMQKIWKSSNNKIVTVSQDGVINAVSNGTAEITLESTDGKVKDTCTITVVTSADNISINKNILNLDIGESSSLTARISPDSVSDKTIYWKSSNESIAFVSQNGNITAVSNGTAYITAETSNALTDRCVISVKTPAEGIALSIENLTLPENTTYQLNANVLPETASNKNIIWESDNENVVTVGNNGQLITLKAGKAVISAKSAENTGLSKSCEISVIEVNNINKTVNLHQHEIDLSKGDTKTLGAYISPATLETVWKSSDESIVKVNQKGEIIALSDGKAVITLKSKDGSLKDSCMINVKTPVKSISLNENNLYLNVNEIYNLNAEVNPKDSTDNTVKWLSSDESIVQVKQNGEIKAVRSGTAVISAVSNDGGFRASCIVSVNVPIQGIKINPNYVDLKVNTGYQLTAQVIPQNSTNKGLIWSSSDKNIAVVNNAGYVLAVGSGTAVIKAKQSESGLYSECTVNVVQPITGLFLNKTELKLNKGETEKLTANVIPQNSTDKNVLWLSSDENIVSVDSNGNVTAVGSGETVITAQAGDYTAQCKVDVVIQPEEIILSNKELILNIDESYVLTANIFPDNIADKSILWTSSNPNVAFINSDGLVTALKAGTSTITAISRQNNKVTASCSITVAKPVTDIGINAEELELSVGDKYVLTAYVNSDAYDKTLKWSSNTSGVTLSSYTGESITIHANKACNAVITVSSADGKFKRSCNVYVSVPVQYIYLDKTELSLNENTNETYQLYSEVKPWNATQSNIIFVSENSSIARVDRNTGLVTAVGKGETTIRAYSGDEMHFAECKVNVVRSVERLELNMTENTIWNGDSFKLNYTFVPALPTNDLVKWISSNDNIAAVDENGNVKGISKGYAEISCINEESGITAVCKVNVKQKAEGINIDVHDLNLAENSKYKLNANVLPENTDSKLIKWISENEDIAAVDDNGNITAVSQGNTKIKAETENGKFSDICNVNVIKKVNEIKLDKNNLLLEKGSSYKLIADIKPNEADNKKVSWSTENENVASVDDNGNVTAIGNGTTNITVTANDGNLKDVCKVDVITGVSGINVDIQDITIKTGDEFTINADVLPIDATNKNINWYSDNEDTARVENGVVKGISAGKAVITAETQDGNFSESCYVTVRTPSGIAFDKSYIEIEQGETKTLNAKVFNKSDSTYIDFKVNDENVAEIVSKNTIDIFSDFETSSSAIELSNINTSGSSVTLEISVKGLNNGVTDIIAETSDGLKDTIKVKVITLAKEILLSDKDINLHIGNKHKINAEVKPESTTNKLLLWESDNKNVVAVDENGFVTALSSGKSVITIKSADGNAETKVKVIVDNINIDIDGNGKPDINIDTNGDGKPDINIDTNGDGKPDINIDTDGDGKPDINIDVDGDGKPDINIDTNGDGKPDINIDVDGDGKPDINIDVDGDGKPDINIDVDGNGKPDVNIDTDGDDKPDINIDTDGDGKPDVNIDVDGDGKLDINIDTDGDDKPDINIDTDGDGKPDVNIDVDGDGKPDINIDIDGDSKPDINIDIDDNGKPDVNIDTDGDSKPDINIDTDGDSKPDINIDTNGDGKPDINEETGNNNTNSGGGSGGTSQGNSNNNKDYTESQEEEIKENINTEKAIINDSYIYIIDYGIQYLLGDENGLRENENITRAETASILSRIFKIDKEAEISFNDVKVEDWYYSALEALNIWVGYEDNTFKPNQYITRAEYASILDRLPKLRNEAERKINYTDININDWYYDSVMSVTNHGIFSGYENNTFKPNQYITRKEAVFALNRLLGYKLQY